MQTRTARFGPDGQLDVGYSFIFPYERYLVTLQALPWVEATFRYTSITNKSFSGNSLGDDKGSTFKDRGADLKFRLRRETKYFPALAAGLQDTLGTGVFSGEYVVASKRYFDLDFSLGMGWGYAAGTGEISNPFISLSDVFRSRSSGGAQGGTVPFGAWFSGEDVGLFGGVEYTTPLKGLTLKLEYDPNDYRSERVAGGLEWQSPWNIGANYRPFEWIDLSVGFERGRQLLVRVSLRADIDQPGLPKFDPPASPLRPRPTQPSAQRRSTANATPHEARDVLAELWSAPDRIGTIRFEPRPVRQPIPAETRLANLLLEEGVAVESVQFRGATATVSYFGSAAQAELHRVEDAVASVASALPDEVETVVFQPASGSAPTVMNRSQLEEASIVAYLFDELESHHVFVESFDLSNSEAIISVSQVPDEPTRLAAAKAIFRAAPVPLESVTFVDGSGFITERREDVLRVDAVVGLFDQLEERGLHVASIDILDSRAIFYVTADERDWQSNAGAARLIATDMLPLSVDAVSFVRLGSQDLGTLASRNRPAQLMPFPAVSGSEGHPTNPVRALSAEERRAIAETMFDELEAEGFVVHGLQLTVGRATIYVRPTRFREGARNIGRAARVVANNAPPSVEELVIVTMNGGVELNRILILRKDLENAVIGNGSPEEIWARASIEAPQRMFLPPDTITKSWRYPQFSWSFAPTLRQHIGSGEAFYLYGIYATLSARIEIARGLSVNAVAARSIYDQFDRIVTASPSALPKVRSDIKEYLQQGENSLVRYQADYLFMPVPNLYGRLSAGIFEEMFGGYGGEILYRPFESRVAVGFDVNWVRQRGFEQRSTFLPYTVYTGHLNLYYDMPWYNLLGQMNIGQYLARDRGVTFQMSRLFDSGVRMGAWATFTNVKFQEFGEGAFDKGFFIALPLDLFQLGSSQQSGIFAFRPLTKDGGQRLHITPRLYDVTAGGNLNGIARDWGRLLD